MSTSHTPSITIGDRVLGTALIVALALTLIHAKASVIAIFLLALVVIMWKVFGGREKLTVPSSSTPVLTFGAFLFWALITSLWSPTPGSAARTVAGLAATSLAGLVIIHTLTHQPNARRTFLSVWTLITYMVGTTGLGLLVLYPNFVAFLFNALGLYAPGETTKLIQPGRWGELEVNRSYFNNSVAAVAVFLFPTLLIIWTYFQGAARNCLTALTAAIAYATVFYSDHDTSKLALIMAPVIFLSAQIALKLTRGLVLLGWVAAVTLFVPASMIAHGQLSLDKASWVPSSARHRVAIWADTAHRALESPLVGHGVRASKHLNTIKAPAKIWAEGHSNKIARHPHNTFLQTFFETGLVGSVLLLLTGITLMRSVTISQKTGPTILTTVTVSTILLAVCWDLWEAWQLALYLLVIAILALGVRAAEARDQTPQSEPHP